MLAEVEALGQIEAALTDACPGVDGPRIAPMLLEQWDEIAYPQAWTQVLRFELVPEAQRGLRAVLAALGRPDPATMDVIQAYQDELNGLVEPLQARATRQDTRVGAAIRAAIEPHLPEPLRAESLSRIALGFVASTPGVTCVLNGMRHPAYVEDAVGAMTLPAVPDVTAVAGALAAATAPG